MISDAYVNVHCDKCQESESYELTALAGGGWDGRNITEAFLVRKGWTVKGDEHFCSICAEDQESGQ